MNRTTKLLLIFLCYSIPLLGQNSVSVDSTLKEIEMFYNTALYVTAELEARRLYEEAELSDSTKVQIEKWIAFSLVAQGKSSAARERFVTILTIDPDFALDPVLTSPKILSVFYDAKAKFSSQQKAQSDTGAVGLPSMRPVTYRTIVFPGWEQMYQGRATSGGIFFGAGIATLGAGIAFEALRSNARSEYLKATIPSEISTKYNSYNMYRKGELYSFIAFAVVYVASEIDVLSNSNANEISFRSSQSGLSGTVLTLSIGF